MPELIKQKTNIEILVAIILFWILRMVLPGMKYLFGASIVFYVIYNVFNFKDLYRQRNFVGEFFSTYTPLWVLTLFYFIGIIQTGGILLKNLKDIFELVVLVLLLFNLFAILHIEKKEEVLIYVIKKITKYIRFSAIIVAILGLFKFYLQVNNIPVFFDTPYGSSMNADKNFYALYSFLGIICYSTILNKKLSLIKSFVHQFFVFVLFANIFLSFSYRALIILSLFFIGLFLLNILSLIKPRYNLIRNARNNTILLLLTLVTFFILCKVYSKSDYFSFIIDYSQLFFSNPIEFSLIAFHYDKWVFAYNLFKELPLINQLFGNGFIYLEVYGEYFNNNKNLIDYPHNPVISSVLYSGIIGGMFTLLFLIVSLYYAVLYFKKYPLFSLMLFVSLLFIFFSGNSIFSVPVFLLFFSISFLIRYQEISDLKIDANLEKPGSKFLKELFDYIMASLMFIMLLPLLFIIGILVLVNMGWPIIYSQTRVGQNGKSFRLHKFRTMRNMSTPTSVAAIEKQRITRLGTFLRKTKIDELPELINIIRGDMSFVGTRPDVPGYADKLEGDDRIILKLKPGITGPASLKYIDEEELIEKQANPQQYNDEIIWPDKVRINKDYYKNWSFFTDIKVIVYTVLRKQL